jgi:patatin-like phospholipase/acyl hydrolase
MIYVRNDEFPKYKGKKVKVILNAGGGLFGYVITYLMSHLDFDLYSKIDVAAGSSIGGILTLLYSVNSDY